MTTFGPQILIEMEVFAVIFKLEIAKIKKPLNLCSYFWIEFLQIKVVQHRKYHLSIRYVKNKRVAGRHMLCFDDRTYFLFQFDIKNLDRLRNYVAHII